MAGGGVVFGGENALKTYRDPRGGDCDCVGEELGVDFSVEGRVDGTLTVLGRDNDERVVVDVVGLHLVDNLPNVGVGGIKSLQQLRRKGVARGVGVSILLLRSVHWVWCKSLAAEGSRNRRADSHTYQLGNYHRRARAERSNYPRCAPGPVRPSIR